MLIAVLVSARAAPTVGLWMARMPRQSFGSVTGRDPFARAPGQPQDTLSAVESVPHDNDRLMAPPPAGLASTVITLAG
jgi:hypothetical protein